MTWIKSRLLRPDGRAVEGRCVTATLMTRPSWLSNAQGQVLGRVSTNTDAAGLWRLDLLPYTAFEDQLAACIYYRISEGGSQVWSVRVPPVLDPETELWMRDVLIDEPQCPQSWVSINKLARLQDVDTESVLGAKPGDFLVMLANGQWGASRGPLPLAVTWTPDPDDLQTVRIIVAAFGGGGARVGFGDGSPEIVVTSTEPFEHRYATPGTYVLTAQDVAWPAFHSSVKVGIKDHLPRTHPFSSGDDPWTVLLWLDEEVDNTRYTVDWGDKSPIEEIGGQTRVPPLPRVPHTYTSAGQYTILVTDLATQRQTQRQVEVAEIGVLITWDTDVRPRTEFRWLANGATWEFQSEGSPPDTGIVPASGIVTRPAAHDVPSGDFGFDFEEVLGGTARRQAHRRVMVPTQWDWRMGVEIAWRAHDDPPGQQTVTVKAPGARTQCTVEWGDGAPSVILDPASPNPVSHRYTLPAPEQGWRLRVTETDIADPRTWTRLVGEPRHVGVPVLSARASGAVDLVIEGIDDPYNDSWFTVAWEATSTPDLVAAVGRTYPAHHTYTTPGTKTIMVDGPGMPSVVTRTVEVVMYGTPTIVVVEALDAQGRLQDPERRTARISVDNSASGGACTVRLGDGTPPRQCLEKETFDHQFPAGDNTYHLIVTSDADTTARGRTTVHIPFGTPRTLFFDIVRKTEPPEDDDGYHVLLKVTGQTPGKRVMVRWASMTEPEPVPPANELAHEYAFSGTYSVTVFYDEPSGESWTLNVPIPLEAQDA